MSSHRRSVPDEAGPGATGAGASRDRSRGSTLQPLAFPAVAVLAAAAQAAVWDVAVVEALLRSFLVVTVGLQGIWAFMGHYFKPDEIAAYIGWPAGNPFQREVAFANLAFGALGVLCLAFDGGFWLATAIGLSVYLFGTASVHLGEIRAHGNLNPGNAGAILLTDALIPVALLVLSGLFFL